MRADQNLLNPSNETNQYSSSNNYSEAYNKKYEGIAAFNEQINNTLQHARSNGGDSQTNLLKEVGEDLQISSKALDELSTNMTFDGIKTFKDHYEEGQPLNQSIMDVAFESLSAKGAELEALRIKETTNEKDKSRRTSIKQEIAMWKKNLVEIRPLVTSAIKGVVEGHYNPNLSFKSDPEIGPVLKQWLDPKSNHDELGIGTHYDKNGEMYITYTPGQVFKSEYENNKKLLDFDPRAEAELEAAKRQIEDEQGFTRDFDKELEDRPVGIKAISVKEALNGFVRKDIKTGNKINDLFGEMIKTSESTIPTQDNRSKIYEYETFDKLHDIAFDSYKELFLTPDSETGEYANIEDLSTRDQLIAGKYRNYKKDLINEKSFLHKLQYKDLGFDESLDKNNDGFMSNNELNDVSKSMLVEILTSPKTSSEREIAAEQWAWYLTNITRQVVEGRRERQERGNASTKKATKEASNEGLSEFAMQLIEKYSK